MNQLFDAMSNPEAFRALLLDTDYAHSLLTKKPMSYAVLLKLDSYVVERADEFLNATGFIDYLLSRYDDIFTTECKIDAKQQKEIVANLKLYDFVQNRVNAKHNEFNDLIKTALHCSNCKKYVEAAMMSIGVDFEAAEVQSAFVELSAKNRSLSKSAY